MRIFEQSIEQDNELTHDGGEGELGGFAGVPEAFVEASEYGIAAAGDQGGHVSLLTLDKEEKTMRIVYSTCDRELKDRIVRQWPEHDPKLWHIENGVTFVALDEDAIVGFISIYPRRMQAPLDAETESFIDIIEVVDGYRKRGIARKLVQLAAESAYHHGHLQLSSWSSEDKVEAIHMWHALGFGLVPHKFKSPKTNQEVRGYRVASPCRLQIEI